MFRFVHQSLCIFCNQLNTNTSSKINVCLLLELILNTVIINPVIFYVIDTHVQSNRPTSSTITFVG